MSKAKLTVTTIEDPTPEALAEAFWSLSSKEQARFYNHLDTIAESYFPFQLQCITEEDGLSLAGRRVMQTIGDYSHWGLVPRIVLDPSTGDTKVI